VATDFRKDVITHYESLMREHEDHVEQNKASERMREHVKILESNVLRMQRILVSRLLRADVH